MNEIPIMSNNFSLHGYLSSSRFAPGFAPRFASRFASTCPKSLFFRVKRFGYRTVEVGARNGDKDLGGRRGNCGESDDRNELSIYGNNLM